MHTNRILHIIPFAHLGGTEKDCYYIIKADKCHQHIVWVLDTDGPMCSEWLKEGAQVDCFNILQHSNNQIVENLEQKLTNEQFFGILYWSTIKLPLIRYALRKQKCRLVVHVGNPSQLTIFSTFKQLIAHFTMYSGIATCLFACSEHVRKTLKTNAYYKIFESRVSLNPVNLLTENPYKNRELAIESEIVIGMTARLDPIKDHETVIKAFEIVLKKYPNAKLWLLGNGILHQSLVKLTNNLGINNSVIFWGNVSNVYEKLQKMDIFVYATTPSEGLGNSVSEALANGLPCVLVDLPMMKEIVGEKQNAIFFEYKNYGDCAYKLELLIKNDQLRQDLSNIAFNRAIETFSAERYKDSRLKYLV